MDGDDEKNSVMSFKQLYNFPGWYKKKVKPILIKPSTEKVSVEDACKEALCEGYRLLSNEIHRFDEPVVGYGLIIYENKMRIKQFLELCIHTVTGIDREALETAISKYGELIDICERALNDWLTEKPKDIAAARSVRQGFDYILRRSRELEAEALYSWATVIKTDCHVLF